MFKTAGTYIIKDNARIDETERHGEKMLELEKKQIHMSRSREPVTAQITLDQDFNVPDSRPDVGTVVLKQAWVLLDEIRQTGERVHLHGTLSFELLYGMDGDRSFQNLTGSLEFDDACGYPGLKEGDLVRCRAETEDFSVRVINSRKLHISAVLGMTMTGSSEEREEAAWRLRGDEAVETLGKDLEIMSLQIRKKDTFRMQDEIRLTGARPPVDTMLWQSISLRSLEYRPEEGNLFVRTEALLFAVYQPEGEQMPLQWIEKPITFQGELPVAGCEPGMIPSVEARLIHRELTPKEDEDGESRVIQAEAVIELDLKLYSEETVHLICDAYSPQKELETEYSPVRLEHLLIKNTAKCRLTEKLALNPADSMLQICHSQGKIVLDRTQPVENGILAEGALQITVLYLAANDERPVQSVSGVLPFHHVIEAGGIRPGNYFDICPMLEQLTTVIAAGGEAEIRAVISFDTLAMADQTVNLLQSVREADTATQKPDSAAPLIGYLVQPGDTLWSVAKRYRVTGQTIREQNGLKQEELTPGMRLLIVRQPA